MHNNMEVWQNCTLGVLGRAVFGPLIVVVLSCMLSVAVYRLYFHPLRHIPGPFLGRVSSLYLYTVSYLGIEARLLRHYHLVYNTKVVRVAPNSVSISDVATLHSIYVANGGFPKDVRYLNFDMGPVETIFSTLDTEYRDARAKPVAGLFAPARLRAASEPRNGKSGEGGVIRRYVTEFVDQLADFRDESQSLFALASAAPLQSRDGFDLLDLCARLSLDVVSGYLLDQAYGGLEESRRLPVETRRTHKLTINPFIFAIVGLSRFSLLPNWLFRRLYALSRRLAFGDEARQCFARMDAFAARLVARAVAAGPGKRHDSYQARLLAAGIAPDEVRVQCQAVVFAGADSTAIKLATILFHLVRNPERRHRLREALLPADGDSGGAAGATTEPQQVPYLRAVVKEGLRLGMANPTRLTRVVPTGKGLQVDGFFLPPGTVVGSAAYVLHHNPDVFPEPFAFRPERWLAPGQDSGLRRPGMEKSLLMFGGGLRACIGKNLAQQQLYETVRAVVQSDVLEGSNTCEERIELVEWFNAEIKGHKLEIEWGWQGGI